MTAHRSRLRLLALPLVPAALFLTACGGGDDSTAKTIESTSTTDAPEATTDCVDRFVQLASRDDVVAAARAGGEVPTELADEFESLDADCADAFDGPDAERLLAALEDVDPVVLEWLAEPAAAEFEKTGDTISGL